MDAPKRKDESEKKRAGSFFVPLLPHLLAGAAAFGTAGTLQYFRQFSAAFLYAGLVFWLCSLSLKFLCGNGGTSKKSAFAVFALKTLGTFFLCFWYFYFRVPANPYPDFAPREAAVVVRIDEVSRGANDSRYGTATILEAPHFAPLMKGAKIWYVVSDGKKRTQDNKRIVTSQIVRLKGVLGGVYPAQAKARGYNAESENTRNFERYLMSRCIYFKIYSPIDNAEILAPAQARFEFYQKAYEYMDGSLSEFPFKAQGESEAAKAYQAMILGDQSRLAPEQKQSFIDTGTMHIFAISGLHVGFVAGMIYMAMGLLRINWRIQPLIALPIVYVYVCACGGRPSAMRAFGMIAIVWLALALGRGVRPFGSLVLAACVALAIAPQNVFDAGFTLSYCIVASLFVYGIPLYGHIKKYGPNRFAAIGSETFWQKLKYAAFTFFGGSLCISIGAFFAGAPLSAHYFSYIAPASVLYSPFFVLGSGVAVWLGFAGFALPGFISQFFNGAAAAIVWTMDESARLGVKALSMAIPVSLPNGFITAAILFAFLGISAACENKGPFLRFWLAPIAVTIMMAVAYFI